MTLEFDTGGMDLLSGAEKQIITPDWCRRNSEVSAGIMLSILQQNYGNHNLTRDIRSLTQQMSEGRIDMFIETINHLPVSCAALIELSQWEVELGRGAKIPSEKGGHSGPMIEAFNSWLEGRSFPKSKILKAEVRTAKPTKEVPGEIATEVVCLKKIGFKPTAIGPFFGHGVPFRQEFFFLASMFRNQDDLEVLLDRLPSVPNNIFRNRDEFLVFTSFWQNFFGREPAFSRGTEQRNYGLRYASNFQGPFIQISPNESGDFGADELMPFLQQEGFNKGQRLAIARLPLSASNPDLESQISHLKNSGFKLVGFEPSVGEGGPRVDILFGILSDETKRKLVLPVFAEGLFDHEIENSLMTISINWRK